MKIAIRSEDGKPYFLIKYEVGEWEEIEKKLQSIGLQKAKISNLWGIGIACEAYRETNEDMLRYLKQTLKNNTYYWKDDLNYPFYDNYGYINISIFRIIPTNNMVQAPLPKFLTIRELNQLVENIKGCLEILLNIAINEEVEVK
jgi:hypothetical protein